MLVVCLSALTLDLCVRLDLSHFIPTGKALLGHNDAVPAEVMPAVALHAVEEEALAPVKCSVGTMQKGSLHLVVFRTDIARRVT